MKNKKRYNNVPEKVIYQSHNNTRIVKAEDTSLNLRNIGFINDAYDCCVEKIEMEYAPFFFKDGFQFLGIPTPNFEDIMKYVCERVILFRTGSNSSHNKYVKSLANYLVYLKQFGVKTFYYTDDLIFTANGGAPLFLAKSCDEIIVATNEIKEFLQNSQNITLPIHVLKTHVDLESFDRLPKFNFVNNNKFKIFLSSGGRIGAIGLLDIVAQMDKEPEYFNGMQVVVNADGVAQIRSIINKYRNVDKMYIDWVSLSTYYALYKAMDLVIAPVTNRDLDYMVAKDLQDLFLNSKSEVKYTLAGAAGIPIIASPTRSYTESIDHGVNGFVAHDTDEFISYIKMLYENKELREKVGQSARKDIEDKYNISKRYEEFKSILYSENTPVIVPSPKKLIYMASGSGGPRTFYEEMKHYVPILNPDYAVTDMPDTTISAALVSAFLNAEVAVRIKECNKDIRLVHRMDGYPMALDGRVDTGMLKIMIETYDKSDEVVWQSNHCKKFWKNDIDTSRGVIIPNGVDLDIFKPDGPKHSLDGDVKLLSVNWSLFKHKRLDLLDKLVDSTHGKYHFNLIGHYYTVDIAKNMEKWKDFNNVTYLGPIYNYTEQGRSALASILRASDALIFTSEMEGSPNTVLEACACGLPIIYNSNSDIVPEICQEWCIPFNDEVTFINALAKLEDANFIKDLKRNVLSIIRDYSIQSCVRKYLEVLSK